MELKMTVWNHFQVANFSITTPMFFFLVCWYYQFDKIPILVCSLFYLMITIPCVYLHLKYYLKNKGEVFILNKDEIVIKKAGKEDHVIQAKDISLITIAKAASLSRGIPLSGVEYYFYAKIEMNNGQLFYTTCLINRKIDALLKQHIDAPTMEWNSLFILFKI